MLKRLRILSKREFKIAVCAANSVVGNVAGGGGGEDGVESSQFEGVEGLAGVVACAGVDESFPACVDERECVPGKGRVGSTETGSKMTFLNEARKLVLSFSRMTFPRIADSKSFASSAI